MRFILSGQAMPLWIADAQAVSYFAGKSPYVPASYADKVPSSWNAVPYADYTSYAAFVNDIQNGNVNKLAKAVMYDNEGWSFTPTSEQNDPATYVRLFAQAAHSIGLIFMSVPSAGIAAKPDSHGNPWTPATWADVYDIQVQGSVENLTNFIARVNASVAPARAANPHCIITAGLTTYPPGAHQAPTPQQIAEAVDATQGVVDGYWLNVPCQSPMVPNCPDAAPNEPLMMEALLLV